MVDLNNKNVLITGGCGFIGSNFIEYINKNYNNLTIVNIDKHGVGYRKMSTLPYRANNKYEEIIFSLCDLDPDSDIFWNGHINKTKFDYIFHFAAESHVDRSISGPQAFIYNNVMGITKLLEMVRLKQPQARVVNVSCYDETTQALTKNGIKSYWEIKTDDEVLSINSENVMEWKKVEKVIIQDYDGDMLHFKSKKVDFMVTPNHRMYYNNSFNDNELLFDSAENVSKFPNKIYLPIGQIESGDLDDVADEEWALYYLYGIYIGDGCSDITTKIQKNKSGFSKKDRMAIRNDKGQFIKSSDHIRGEVGEVTSNGRRIFIHVPTGDKARSNTEKALDILDIKWTKIQKNTTYDYIYTSNKDFYDRVQQFGKDAKTKRIPSDMLRNLTKKQAKALFFGLIDSDGSYTKSGQPWVLNTSSFELVQNVCNLGVMLGYSPRFSRRDCLSTLNGRLIKGFGYCVYFRKYKKILNSKIEPKKYKGKIWCLKVEDNKNFITVRNGICGVSGNTDEVYGHLEYYKAPPFTERSNLNPRSPYSASKASADLIANSYAETFGLDIITTRCCNNFGPHQHDEKFIPTIVSRLIRNSPIPLYGDGKNMREWIYVEDHNKSILDIVEDKTSKGVYNIGSYNEYTNFNLIQIIANILNIKPNIKYVEDRKGHDFRYALTSERYKRSFILDDFTSALESTVKFYADKYAGKD